MSSVLAKVFYGNTFSRLTPANLATYKYVRLKSIFRIYLSCAYTSFYSSLLCFGGTLLEIDALFYFLQCEKPGLHGECCQGPDFQADILDGCSGEGG